MATNETHFDPLRNPQVDYERADLSPRGILWFLIGMLVAGVFIELVLWGMFHFMARSQKLFPQPAMNPMYQAQQAQKSPAAGGARSVLQNTPPINLNVFPEPRLQPNDAGDMGRFLAAEQELLNVKQPFADSSGAVHIPIALAMQLIVERSLPVRSNVPPPEISTLTAAGDTKIVDMQAGSLGATTGEDASKASSGNGSDNSTGAPSSSVPASGERKP
jgi:hypothetical protein